MIQSDDSELSFLDRVVWLLQRRPHPIHHPLATSGNSISRDVELASRIMTAYCGAMEKYRPSSSFWDQSFFAIKRNIHDTIMSGRIEAIEDILANPIETSLFWGFDGPTKPPREAWSNADTAPRDPHAFVLHNVNAITDWHQLYSVWLMDSLFSVSEAMGVLRVDYPEISLEMPRQYPAGSTADEIIDLIDEKLDITLHFPNPFPGELGLPSRRGIVSFRAIQALYQAWRIWTLAKQNENFSVLEIGAGLGRTAYFAKALGIKSYTIIDIPMTNVAQADFLFRTLNPADVSLFNETGASISILPSSMIDELSEDFNLIVNVDSFTEISLENLHKYYSFARKSKTPILSINHEYNHHTFMQIYSQDPMADAIRYPYWPRRGYVEEIVTWRAG